MRKLAIVLLGSLVLLFAISSLALPPGNYTSVAPAGTAIVHDTAYIQSGELLMFVNNNGSFAYDRTAFFGKNDGLHYPGTCTMTVLYSAGLWLGAKVGNQVRVAAAEYAFDYTAGTMTGGLPTPGSPQFRVYKIRRGDTHLTNADYAEWPFADGAPALKNSQGVDSLDGLGQKIPMLLGDEATWTVFNDADMTAHNSDPGSGSMGPLGLEVQLYSYAFDSAGSLGRIIFMNYTLINKGGNLLDSVHVAFWADPDIGYPGDDFVGCDTTLDVGYCYNSYPPDAVYGDVPPSVGIGLLAGPVVAAPGEIAWKPARRRWTPGYRNLDMSAFSKYINGTDPSNNAETWNYMRGKQIDGTPGLDPTTGRTTLFAVSGDPLTTSGWLDNNAGDRRFMMTSGAFDMSPGDTQEVAIAVMVGSTYSFECGISIFADTIHAQHVAGTSGGRAFALLARPDSTTGHNYQITFTGPVYDVRWHLWDIDLGQEILPGQANISGKGEYPFIDGLLVKVIGSEPGIGGWEIPNGTRRFSWVGGDGGFGLEGFNGAMTWDSPCHFFGICPDPGVPAQNLRRVLLKLASTDSDGNFSDADPNVSHAYRYLRAATSPPAQPQFIPFIINQSQNYGFQAFEKSVPLSAWDVDSDPPRRLVVGHLENNVAGGMVDGKYWPPVLADNTGSTFPREWLFIFDAEYSESINPAFTGSALTDPLPIMYMSMASRRENAAWLTGDEFLIIPVDSGLFFTETDVYTFTAPPPTTAMSGMAGSMDHLASITDLRHLDSVAHAKFEELHWTCSCPCLADLSCAGETESVVNVLDIVGFIDVAFRGVPSVSDRPCPTERTDVNCDHVTDIRDVVTTIDVAFRGADPALRFCDPCNQP